MSIKHIIDWFELENPIQSLATKAEHEVQARREAIPLIFVPGIMGSNLRRPGTNGAGEANGLPNLRWNPADAKWAITNLFMRGAERRRRLLVGEPNDEFSPDFLEVDNDTPAGNGFRGIMADYLKFLDPLRTHNWGELDKVFEFPVYAVGYNWSDDVLHAGEKLMERIDEITAEALEITGLCDKVILITHSMGGLVSRAASELCKGRSKIIGIVHGVQPVNGAPAAYWRMKAGFEGSDKAGMVQSCLGNDGTRVSVCLGNLPGGLELLPNKLHRTNGAATEWLKVTEAGKEIVSLPKADPYKEIYREKAIVHTKKGESPSTNTYWMLLDPKLLNPARPTPEGGNANDELNADNYDPWTVYLDHLKIAEEFHDHLSPPTGPKHHPQSLCISGKTEKKVTADVVEMKVETNWVRKDPYPTQGFRGFFRSANGKDMQAVLQDPEGDGDGTVVLSSGVALDQKGRPKPEDAERPVNHQPAYEDPAVQAWSHLAIAALAKHHFFERRKEAAAKKGK
jgi:hypothetical protein